MVNGAEGGRGLVCASDGAGDGIGYHVIITVIDNRCTFVLSHAASSQCMHRCIMRLDDYTTDTVYGMYAYVRM